MQTARVAFSGPLFTLLRLNGTSPFQGTSDPRLQLGDQLPDLMMCIIGVDEAAERIGLLPASFVRSLCGWLLAPALTVLRELLGRDI